ncbi:MAG: hypothetical protein LAT78_00910 [Roseinatronobacter sp.]|nr:hypothetical protein [Roseinatronobacter sp.]
MEDANFVFDPAIYERTASLFALKRTAFAPQAVEALASDVLMRLATYTVAQEAHVAPEITAESVDAFCEALIQPDPEAAQRFVEARRAEGLTRMGVYFGYISAAACTLGEKWDNDELSFMDVTLGTGHLYALMRALRAERAVDFRKFNDERRALFATVPGENHGIGVTIAADHFRENNWQIDLQIGTDFDTLVTHAQQTCPRIIGLSLSTEERLDTLARLVVALRLVVPDAIIGVAPAGGLVSARIGALADVDLVFSRADTASDDLESLIAQQAPGVSAHG